MFRFTCGSLWWLTLLYRCRTREITRAYAFVESYLNERVMPASSHDCLFIRRVTTRLNSNKNSKDNSSGIYALIRVLD